MNIIFKDVLLWAWFSAQLLSELVRAYCEENDLNGAAALMEMIEKSKMSQEPILQMLVARTRMVFLAFVGKSTAVEALVGPQGPLDQLPHAAKKYWSGIAQMRAGDRSGARAALGEAIRLSDRDERARRVAEEHLALIDEPGAVGPHVIGPYAAKMAEDIIARFSEGDAIATAKTSMPSFSHVVWTKIPVTYVLVAANLLVAAAMALIFGSLGDVGGLVSHGGQFKISHLSR